MNLPAVSVFRAMVTDLDRIDIERGIAEITANKDYTRRLPASDEKAYGGIVDAINCLLAEVESREKLLRERLADLADARDDAQTSNLLLKRVKDELRSRGVQLDGALKKAAAASSAKSMFLANMSHEIRTPMNGILGMAELLNRSELNPRQRQQVGTIVHSGRALLTIINDILDFSKIESGKYELDPKPFDLKLCLGDIVELLTPTATRKSLGISLEFGADLPRHYVGDAGRIRQVVMNLAGNAVKFTDSGSVTLRISGTQLDGQASLLIEIIDTGIGIPAEQLADVFEKFSQVDSTGTRRHEGTGLGLSICQLLADRMNGAITAESLLGVGSKFSFSLVLPVHVQPVAVVSPLPDLQGKTIALVGESSDIELTQSALAKSNCSIITAKRLTDLGMGIGQSVQTGPIDVVVVASVAVPEMLDREISAFRFTAGNSVPVVVQVSGGAPGDAQLVTHAGGQAYLAGEFDATALVNMLRHVLSESSKPKASIAGNDTAQAPLITRHSIAESVAAKNDKPAARSGADKRRYKVLVVDDSMVNQEIAAEFLQDLECDVEMANNGAEAVEATAKSYFDLILMDCQMPVMDGFAATAAIRGRHGAPTASSVPIVALTANAFASDREKCLASGMSDFLSKPFLPTEFDSVVQKWLTTEAVAA
jgi:signal transduction histidine kinase/CheY-like chemotaxis protein